MIFFHFFFVSTRFMPHYFVTLHPKMTDTHFRGHKTKRIFKSEAENGGRT